MVRACPWRPPASRSCRRRRRGSTPQPAGRACQCQLRSAQGLRPDRADRLAAKRADGAPVAAGAYAFRELIAYAKANPGKVNYGFVPGTVGHMTAEMFARSAGIELTRIPYKGNGQAIGDLIGGHLSMMVLSLSPILGNVKDGKYGAPLAAYGAAPGIVQRRIYVQEPPRPPVPYGRWRGW